MNALANETMILEVTIKNVYGTETVYPQNFTAETFAAIAGTKTLTMATLKYAKALGYQLVVIPSFTARI